MDVRGQHGGAIAIVGIACQFPGARDPAEFHALTVAGRRMFRPISGPAGRGLYGALLDDWAAPADGPGQRDPGPLHKLTAETIALALADAGIRETGIREAGPGPLENAALIIASTIPDVCRVARRGFGISAADDFPRAAYLDSLRAVTAACDALSAGAADLVAAGGAELGVADDWLTRRAAAGDLGTTQMRVYDAEPTGLLPGDGCGIVVLMRSADARAAGLPVYAEVTGWAARQASPDAYDQAMVGPADVQLVEGHGAGTAAGDLAELSALSRLRVGSSDIAALGAVSASIGYAAGAAGMASLIKVVAAMVSGTIPPAVGWIRPHRLIESGQARLRLPAAPEPWPEGTRLAAVNSLGPAEGTADGAHLVLRRQVDEAGHGRRRRGSHAATAHANGASADLPVPAAARPTAPGRHTARITAATHAAPAGLTASAEPAGSTPADEAAVGVAAARPTAFAEPAVGVAAAGEVTGGGATGSGVAEVPAARTGGGAEAASSSNGAAEVPAARTGGGAVAASPPEVISAARIALSPQAMSGSPVLPGLSAAPASLAVSATLGSASEDEGAPLAVFALCGAEPAAVAATLDVIAGRAAELTVADLRDLARNLAAAAQRTAERSAAVRVAVTAATPRQLAGRAQDAARRLRGGALGSVVHEPGISLSAGAAGRIVIVFPGLAATAAAHAAMLATSLGALTTLDRLGVTAKSAVGYSLGEIAGLVWAGCLAPAEAARLAGLHGRILQGCASPTAATARVAADTTLARQLCSQDGLHIAAYEAPGLQLLTGHSDGIRSLVRRCTAAGVPVEVLAGTGGLHSPALARCAAPLRTVLASIPLAPPRRLLVSTVTGQPLTANDDTAALLTSQLTRPVLFAQAMALAGEQADLIMVAGPQPGLAAIAALAAGGPAITLPPASTLAAAGTTPAELVAALFAAGAIDDLTPFLLARQQEPDLVTWAVPPMRDGSQEGAQRPGTGSAGRSEKWFLKSSGR
jgi:enediyne polyketide synthase